MNRKQLEKQLDKMQYDLKDTGHFDGRWMVRSRVLEYHWSFDTLDGVRRFVVDEKAMYRYARKGLWLYQLVQLLGSENDY